MDYNATKPDNDVNFAIYLSTTFESMEAEKIKILKVKVMRGPNVWSTTIHQLIQLRIDLQGSGDAPSDKLEIITARIIQMMPSLPKPAGAKSIIQLVEWLAQELQSLAGMGSAYTATHPTRDAGIYNVLFEYYDEDAGKLTAGTVIGIINAAIAGLPYDIEGAVAELKDIYFSSQLGPSTKSIVDEAVKRGITWIRLSKGSAIQLGYGASQKRFQATMTCFTNALAVDIACDKRQTKALLNDAEIPVAPGGTCTDAQELADIIERIGFPIVIKPLDGNQGKGATTNITTYEQAIAALEFAQTYTRRVIVEKHITGHDYRLLVINNAFVAAAKRLPAFVTGNGRDSIVTLIEELNSDPRRGNGHENILTKISIDRDTEEVLSAKGYTIDSIPRAGEMVWLKSTANLSTGGSAIDVTDAIHPDNIAMAERIARLIGLDICGIDIMSPDITVPLQEAGGAVLEVNAAPGFRMHLAPSAGTPRNVAAPVLDMLYPKGSPGSIPIIAVTGTNGKTTTTRLVAHIIRRAGYRTGYTTTDGIYIDNEKLVSGDTTGPQSAAMLLKDPSVEFAVLETARGGILRSGLFYKECDIAILTNIREDHLGLEDINTIEDLARVKAVVPRTVKNGGWAILNGDDEQCLKIAATLQCNVAYFSTDAESGHTKQLLEAGHTVACCQNDFIMICRGTEKIHITNVRKIPLTYDGTATFMVANVLAATLAAYLWGVKPLDISNSLKLFIPGYTTTPGRMNLFNCRNFKVLVDYAHNPHGYGAIEEYLKGVTAARKIGIISGVGDRRDQDIRECGAIAGRMFDHVIVRQERDLRNSSAERINALLLDGMRENGTAPSCEFIDDEAAAVSHALQMAGENDFVVALTDDIDAVVETIEKYKCDLEKYPVTNKLPESA